MSASGQGPTERAKQWARVNLENVVGAKLHKHDMCGWDSKGLANLTVKEEYGGWMWRTLSSAVKKLWPSVVKIRGEKGKTDYLKDVRLKSSRHNRNTGPPPGEKNPIMAVTFATRGDKPTKMVRWEG